MKLSPSADLLAFLEEVMQCESNVYFETCDGDKLNLKSLLSQYLFAALTGQAVLLETGVLKCDDAKDASRLQKYCDSTTQ